MLLDKIGTHYKKIIILLFFLFLLLRLTLIFTSNTELYLGDTENVLFNISRLILEGTKVHIYDLQHASYEGSSLFDPIMGALFLRLFGNSYEAFKMLNLCYSLIFAIILYYFMKDYFNKKSAALSLLLIALPPTFYTVCSLITQGGITNSSILTLSIIFVLFKIMDSAKDKIFLYVLFGFLCGFSVWYHYINLIAIMLSWLFLVIYKREVIFSRRFIVSYGGSFLLGFLPWINYNMHHHFAGLDRLIDSFSDEYLNQPNILSRLSAPSQLNAIIINLKTLSPKLFPALYRFKDIGFINKKVLAYTYYLISLFSFLYLFLFDRKNKKTKFILNYILLYVFIFDNRQAQGNGVPEEVPIKGFSDDTGYSTLFYRHVGLEVVMTASHVRAG